MKYTLLISFFIRLIHENAEKIKNLAEIGKGFYCFSLLNTLNFFIAERIEYLTKQHFCNSISVVILVLLFSSLPFQCAQPEKTDEPFFTLQNLNPIVRDITSNYISSARFDPGGRQIIFNGRLDGDSWDCIYTIPAQGGEYRKIIESTDDLYFPSFSRNGDKILYTKGFARQIMLFDTASGATTELPIFGNTPILLPDDETVLYSGVIDANLKLYHIPSRQNRNLTESYISANFAPALLTDNIHVTWIEKQRNGVFKLIRGSLKSDDRQTVLENRKPLLGISNSPGGQWTLTNYQDGSLSAVNIADTSTARVVFRFDDEEQTQNPLVSLPNWSATGSQLVFSSVVPDKYSSINPFFKHGYFKADLVVADLKWDKIGNDDIVRPMAAQPIDLFPKPPEQPIPAPEEKRNNPPTIVSTPPTTVIEGDLFIYRVNAIDIDLFDKIEYRRTAGPADAEMLNKTGILYWIAGAPGIYQFSVAASDGKMVNRQTFSVEVLPKPAWSTTKYLKNPAPSTGNEYIAGLFFKDPNNDGFLSAGENAQLLIDLRTRSATIDSIKLQLLTTVNAGEIKMEHDLIFERCSPDRWSRKVIPIRGLENLRNRPILIRGILQDSSGITLLPASLLISANNPNID